MCVHSLHQDVLVQYLIVSPHIELLIVELRVEKSEPRNQDTQTA